MISLISFTHGFEECHSLMISLVSFTHGFEECHSLRISLISFRNGSGWSTSSATTQLSSLQCTLNVSTASDLLGQWCIAISSTMTWRTREVRFRGRDARRCPSRPSRVTRVYTCGALVRASSQVLSHLLVSVSPLSGRLLLCDIEHKDVLSDSKAILTRSGSCCTSNPFGICTS